MAAPRRYNISDSGHIQYDYFGDYVVLTTNEYNKLVEQINIIKILLLELTQGKDNKLVTKLVSIDSEMIETEYPPSGG